jgi:hypothetical protein
VWKDGKEEEEEEEENKTEDERRRVFNIHKSIRAADRLMAFVDDL